MAACKSATPYAAKVNGEVLSKSGLDNELNAIRGNAKYFALLKQAQVPVDGEGDGTFNSQFVATILSRRIFIELIHQEVERRKLTITKKNLADARTEIIGQIGDETIFDAFPESFQTEIVRTTAEVLVLQRALVDTSDANLRRYYDDHLEQFESVCAAHILVATEDEADAIETTLAKAKDKKATFADLAKEKSTDTGSGANGGDLGCAAPGGYVAEFKDAVRTQKIGVIGEPVKTQFGYHIIRVDSREDAKPFDEVTDQVRTAITESGQDAFTEFLREASTEAEIEVNPRYGTYDTTGESPQVVPPKAPAAGSDSGN